MLTAIRDKRYMDYIQQKKYRFTITDEFPASSCYVPLVKKNTNKECLLQFHSVNILCFIFFICFFLRNCYYYYYYMSCFWFSFHLSQYQIKHFLLLLQFEFEPFHTSSFSFPFSFFLFTILAHLLL